MLLETISSLNKDMHATILMVTHDAFSASYCDRIIFIKDGKIFTELIKGNKSRSAFFNEIIDVLTLLGGTYLMYAKLSIRNGKRSIKDYLIFLSLWLLHFH